MEYFDRDFGIPYLVTTLYLYEFYQNIIMLNKKALLLRAPSFS